MFILPKLPYSYDALEPYIDARTMEIHLHKHHQAYVDNVNTALEKYPQLQEKPLELLLQDLSLLPDDIRTAVRNNGGGHYNHSLFWDMMKPKGSALRGLLSEDIQQQFGHFNTFKEQFELAAKSRFGSGWAWLVLNKRGDLEVISTANQDAPLELGCEPVLALDIWEHAYYLQYQNRRVDYIQAWWHVVNWEFVLERYLELLGK